MQSMQTHPHRVLAFMSDCNPANIAAYNDGLKEMYPYADCNGCLPHTGHHVGQKLETPNVNEFMLLYNACVGHSTLARMLFRESTGKAPLRCSKTLWFSINDVQEKSLLPNALNGNLHTWVEALRRVDACPAIAPKMQEFFTASTHKVRMFQLELTVLVHVGVEARLFEDRHFPIVIVHGCIHISEIPLEPPPNPPPTPPPPYAYSLITIASPLPSIPQASASKRATRSSRAMTSSSSPVSTLSRTWAGTSRTT